MPYRHTLHYFADRHKAEAQAASKLTAERYFIGLLAGVALFYLMGKAVGLGHH
jgi:hypothetical protein